MVRVGEVRQRGGFADDHKQESGDQSPATVEAKKEAYDLGKRAAQGPKDLEVDCPYANGSTLFREWLRGFEENGGTVDPT